MTNSHMNDYDMDAPQSCDLNPRSIIFHPRMAGKKTLWRKLNEIQRKINRAQSKRIEDIIKAREERRMTEIRIEEGECWSCNFEGEDEEECRQPARRWRVDGTTLIWLCKYHGKGVLSALRHPSNKCLTITGGYDEPKLKSRLVAARDSISQATPFAGKYALEAILEHLIKEEQSDDFS